jgi:hypothetical protein
MAHYIHHVPGRLRIRTPQLKRDALRAEAAVVSAETILEALALRGYYQPELVQHADHQLPAMAARAGDALSKALFGMVLEKSALVLIGAIL